METVLDEGFSLGIIRVYPLDFLIEGPHGKKELSPIAMEILTELAKANGAPVTSEHLISQVWGHLTPDPGSLEHYIAELQHLLHHGGHDLILANDLCYWLADTPEVIIPAAAKNEGFLAELQRRKVTQTAALYLVAAWLLIQIADVVFPRLGLDEDAVRIIVITAIAGFPITLVLSWFYDLKRTDNPDAGDDIPRSLAYVFAGALIALPISYGYQWFYGVEVQADPAPIVTIEQIEPEPNSIAVLSFLNLGSDDTYDYFSDGVAEEILTALSVTGKMLVAPRTSSFSFKESKATIKEIGLRLGVAYVLEGGVRREANRVRVSANLIDVLTGYTVWTNTYDQELSNIFDMQQDISRQVVSALDIVLSAESSQALGVARTKNVDAYDYYLQGRDYLSRPTTERTINSAIQLFDRAIALDPEYADAYAGLCDSFLAEYIQTNTTAWFTKAEKACKATLRFDFVTIDVRIALGNLYRQSGQYKLSAEQLAIALQKAPDNIDALSALAKTYTDDNKLTEAEELLHRAIELQPRFWRSHDNLGNFLFQVGRYADAVPVYRRSVELTPDNATAYNNLGAALQMVNEFDQAAEALQKSLEIEVTESASSNAGSSLFFAGRFDEAAVMYRQATELAPDRFDLWGNLADAERLGSHPDAAIDHYRRAITLAEDALSINPNNGMTMALLSHYSAGAGQPERAQELLTQATSTAPNDVYVWYYATLVWLTLDNKELAAQSLQQAIELGYPVAMVLADQGLSDLTSDSGYRSELGL